MATNGFFFPKKQQPELFDHGIYQENSDIRAHVSPMEKIVYVFKTVEGTRARETNNAPLVDGYQPGVDGRTATGWLVKPDWISDLRRLRFESWTGWDLYDPDASTSFKGKFAVSCVTLLMKLGRFPIWVEAEEDERKEVQIVGTDILLFCKKKIQVKLDGKVHLNGNLFLQNQERNPLKLY